MKRTEIIVGWYTCRCYEVLLAYCCP